MAEDPEESTITVAEIDAGIRAALEHTEYQLGDRREKFADPAVLAKLRGDQTFKANVAAGRVFAPIQFIPRTGPA